MDGSATRTSPALQRIREETIADPANRDATAAGLQPIYTAHPAARIVLIGQAPGTRAQRSGIPWNDPSGVTLRHWLGITDDQFYDPTLFAILPMDFYYPSKAAHGDLLPRPQHRTTLASTAPRGAPHVRLTVLIGRDAQKHYLPESAGANLTDTVRAFRDYLPDRRRRVAGVARRWGVAGGDRAAQWPVRAAFTAARAVAAPARDARPGEDRGRPRDRDRAGRGRRLRHRGAACPARGVGQVASDPTASRLITRLAAEADAAVAAIAAGWADARERVWQVAEAPAQDGRVVIDLDASLVTAHSKKEDATRTWKKGFGFHPLLSFVDHGGPSGREPVAELLRPRRAGANTAADHVVVLDAALAQLPAALRTRDAAGRVPVLARADAAGATKEFATHLHERGVEFSIGARFAHLDVHTALAQLPMQAWNPPYQARKPRAAETGVQIEPRDGAWVAEATSLLQLRGWPEGTRLILRKERPHPGAQLRTTDADEMRITGFLTNTTHGRPAHQLADLELRHRRHARAEDRIRAAKDTGPRNLPFHDMNQNNIWVAIAALAQDLLAWCTRLALPTTAASYEPKRTRLRILATAGRLVRTARHRVLHIDPTCPGPRRSPPPTHDSARSQPPKPHPRPPTRTRSTGRPRRAGDHAHRPREPRHRRSTAAKPRSQYERHERSPRIFSPRESCGCRGVAIAAPGAVTETRC
jgi:uracil-DNA glycosylase